MGVLRGVRLLGGVALTMLALQVSSSGLWYWVFVFPLGVFSVDSAVVKLKRWRRNTSFACLKKSLGNLTVIEAFFLGLYVSQVSLLYRQKTAVVYEIRFVC